MPIHVMTPSMIAAMLWLAAAALVVLVPGRDGQDRLTALLVVLGVPLTGWLTLQNGPWLALAGLSAGAWVLRFPPQGLARRLAGAVERAAS